MTIRIRSITMSTIALLVLGACSADTSSNDAAAPAEPTQLAQDKVVEPEVGQAPEPEPAETPALEGPPPETLEDAISYDQTLFGMAQLWPLRPDEKNRAECTQYLADPTWLDREWASSSDGTELNIEAMHDFYEIACEEYKS